MQNPFRPTHSQASLPLGDTLRPALLVAVLVEVLFLRLALRFGQALPPDERLGQAFTWVATVGMVAQNLAVILGTLVLADLALRQLQHEGLPQRVCGLLLLGAGAGTVMLVVGGPLPGLFIATAVLSLGAMVAALLSALASPENRRRGFWLALALPVYSALYYHYLAQTASGLGWHLPGMAPAYFIGEGLAVAAALALPLVIRPRWEWGRAVALAVPAVLLLGALQGRPWTVASLSVWTVGFTLFLPGVVYALALAAFLYTVSALARGSATEPRLALGLALIALAGLKLDYSYFTLLALLGVSFVAGVGAVTAHINQTAPRRVAASGGNPATVSALEP